MVTLALYRNEKESVRTKTRHRSRDNFSIFHTAGVNVWRKTPNGILSFTAFDICSHSSAFGSIDKYHLSVLYGQAFFSFYTIVWKININRINRRSRISCLKRTRFWFPFERWNLSIDVTLFRFVFSHIILDLSRFIQCFSVWKFFFIWSSRTNCSRDGNETGFGFILFQWRMWFDWKKKCIFFKYL